MRDKPNEKIKDMARSVLPSKNRKGAHDDKRAMHRGSRRRARQQLEWMEDLETEDFQDSEGFFFFWEDDLLNKTNEQRPEISTIVSDRRNADKVRPFIRWAKANSKHLKSDLQKYYHIKQKIGSSVIKDHALGHFVYLKGAQNPFHGKFILGDNQYTHTRSTPWQTKQQLTDWLTQAFYRLSSSEFHGGFA
jgi:hypothetical protein